MSKPLFAAAAALALLAVPATAAINAKQLNQQRLIDAGARSGKLTVRETRVLRAEQLDITREKAALIARHGGRYTPASQRRIENRQQAAKAHIQRLKYNAAVR